ncbi:MAG: alanine racemase [Candidatus Paceibacterota bacterium]
MELIETGRPQLILDEFRCKRNINRLASKAKRQNLQFRPHFKTHQSLEIGKWFREAGVDSITVSSVDMASYFASDGWNDITIAFPFYPGQISALKKLERTVQLRLFINNKNQLSVLSKSLHKPFHVIIEIDPGYGRSGVHFSGQTQIDEIINECERSTLATFDGFYVHDGRTYQSRGKKDILDHIKPVLKVLNALKNNYPSSHCIMGDTPSCSVLEDFESIDVITPGNFVFYDWMQVLIGSCTIDDVALYCQVPIAQIIDNGNKAILHGGAVHLSKDSISKNRHSCFGQAIKYSKNEINIIENTFINSLSQEHGIAVGNFNELERNSLMICPIHSCLTANLHSHYLTTTGKIIEKRILS